MTGEKQFTQAKTRLSSGQIAEGTTVVSRASTRIIGLLVILLLAGDAAFADLLVQPLVLRRTVQPGKRYTEEMKLENSDPQVDESISLRLAELTQKPDASWTEILPDDPNLSKAVVRSCRSWLTIPSNTVPVPSYKIVPFSLQIDVPAGTRGFYFASIVASTAPRMVNIAGVVTPMRMEITVAVILEVQSTPMQHRVSVAEVGLETQAATEKTPAATNAIMDVTNEGGTLSRLLPVVRLWGRSGGHWLRLSETKLTEIVIMPGVKLHLKHTLPQTLPAGDYRMEGFLFVDGQRGSRLQKDLQFKGDPRATGLRGQAMLNVQPGSLFVDCVPGATRSATIRVTNVSEDEVTVDVAVALPGHFGAAVNANGVRGDDLGCADWVTVTPNKFTMKGHTQRSLSVLAKMPKESKKYPSYYGVLNFSVSYADGKPGTAKETYVCVQNKQGVGTPSVAPTVLTVSEASPSRYLTTGGFMNSGETHVTPTCQGVLSVVGAGGGGAAIYKRFQMTSEAYGQTGIQLPLETRSFSGTLDISDVPPGDYYVTAILQYPAGPADGVQEQRIIRVSEQGGQKIARMIGSASGSAPVIIKMQ